MSRSVFRDHRAAPAVVHPHRHQIGIAMNAVTADKGAGWAREGRIVAGDEQMVVFDPGRPVRREGEFEAGTKRTTPAVVARGGRRHSAAGKDVVTIGDYGGAALHIEQSGVPGVSDLAGE